MLKLEDGLSSQSVSALRPPEELEGLTSDINDLKQQISDQISLIQELTWEAQPTAGAKAALHEMQETLRDWYAHRDLLVKLQAPEPQPA